MAKDTVGTQLSLFGDLFDEQPVTAEKPAPAAKVPAARWAELNGILNQAAYAYYALDAPEHEAGPPKGAGFREGRARWRVATRTFACSLRTMPRTW